MNNHPLVSCLCVTHRRVAMLERAIACFDRQTWPNRELVLLHQDDDTETRDFLAARGHPLVRSVVVPALPRLTMGAKRRITVEAARGHYVATWDDDDWSAPTRLAEQIEVLGKSGRSACTLERWIVFDSSLGEAWLSQVRPWEASLVAVRSALPAYEAVDREEDLRMLRAIVAANQLALLRGPHLYVYVYHGTNIGSRAHFKRNIFAHSARLPAAFAARVANLLRQRDATPLTLAQVLEAAGPAAAPGPPRP